jgi:hypothetical protein
VEWAIEESPGEPDGRLMLLQCRPETVWTQHKHATCNAVAGMNGLVTNLLTPVRIRV